MKMSEFARRRRQLMRMMGTDSIAILPAAPERVRNRDVEYVYRQDSDFQYLTGFPEPEAVAVLAPGRRHGEYILFCRPRDPDRETWTGARAGQEGAVEAFGADDSFPIGDLDDILPGLLEGRERVFYTMGRHPEFDQRLIAWVNRIRDNTRAGSRAPGEFVALDPMLHEMRLFKGAAELRVMRATARIAMEAHRRAMQVCRPGMMEYEIEAELLHHFRRHGAQNAYPPIVGGGANGCVLHYISNDQPLQDGDLLLIDAGAELECYASDITRTFPVNGRFSPAQRAVYELVLKAQHAAIAKVRPGNHWNDPHHAAVKVLTEGMVELGLLKGKPAALIRDEAYRRFYMHRTGHWMGMDVHDVGEYKVAGKWRLLEPGMVLTVEPGLYIPAGSKGVAKKWWNIGVRIEDDVLVTATGHEVLTGGLAKGVEEIEAWMARKAS
ncbi:MAG: Xaa-Pro aminopeptidase [Chromatiales bacterium 21-64-14]|nr:MAG: Xaa-Pro aminopeptidase [Chromatiales bacterium 21-64-14]HQU16143.1 Xaa-Pro aminopeptidase [Gammaproteobacteria bacterium]